MKPYKSASLFLCFCFVSDVLSDVIFGDRSYLRVDSGVYSKMTVSIDEGVTQPKHCPTFLDNLEVRQHSESYSKVRI